MTEPVTRKVSAHPSLGTLQTGDKLLGERVSGTTGLLTVGSLGGAVDSVNGQTGVVVLDADSLSDVSTTNKFTSAADELRLATTSGTNTGDQATIVGITGTKAEYNTSVTDGDFLYSGDVTQYTDELAQDAVGAMVGTSLVYNDGSATLQRAALSGDVTASQDSNTTVIANDAVTYAKIQNVSATDKLLGRSTSGAGDVEEITCTAAGRDLIDDVDAAAQRTTLGLGTLATQSGTFSGTSSGTNTGDQTSIVGITGTKTQFNTAVTSDDLVFTSDLGTNVATFLATPSSANLAAALTDETGTNKSVFSDNPALKQPTADNFIAGYSTTATAAGTTTLTVASNNTQVFTGSTTQTVVLPVVSTLVLGTAYKIVNLSSGVVTVQSSGANTIQAMQANSTLILVSNATTGTGTSVWYVVEYTSAASGQTGSGSLVRATSPTFTTPVLGAASATSLSFSSTSGIIGSATNDSAATGSVGEIVTNTTAANSTSLTTGVIADCCTISLTAGDWDIFGNLALFGGATTQLTFIKTWTSASSVTDPGGSLYCDFFLAAGTTPFATAPFNLACPFLRVSLSGTSTIYLSVQALFTVSTCTAGGSLYARRRR